MAKDFEAKGCRVIGIVEDAYQEDKAQKARELLQEAGVEYLNLTGNPDLVNQLAPAGYEVDAMGFLIKPVSYGMLDRTITRALNKARHHRSALLQLKEGKNSRYVDAHSITYVETVGKHTRVHADSGSFDCGDTLKAIELAAGEGFYRIHNAYLVNLDRIESATQTEVMVANERLPLSKHRRKDFFKALSSYIGGLV